jgi:hypothetical protein
MASGKKGCFSRILKVFFVLLIVLGVLSFILAILTFGTPESFPAPKFDGRAKGIMAGTITRLARSLVDKEGRVVDVAELHLTQKEVQTLLDAMMRDDRADAPETVPYAVLWEDGMIRFFYSETSDAILPPFSGKAVNLLIELTPYVDDGRLTIDPGSGSIGKVPIPRFALNKLARWMEKDLMRRDNIRTTLSAFKSIEPGEDGTLVLMFDPRDVNTVVRILRSAGEDPREEPDRDEEEEDDATEDEEGEEEEEDEDLTEDRESDPRETEENEE